MKRKYRYRINQKTVEREYSYIPVRYIWAILLTMLETLAVIGIVLALCYFVPYFYIAAVLTSIGCIINIIASDDNPDYKAPWILIVLTVPVAGFMIYFMFYSRKLKPKFIHRLEQLERSTYQKDDTEELQAIEDCDKYSASQARMLCKIANTHLFTDTNATYLPLGEDMHKALLSDLRSAQKFIYMEYFIIEEGRFWNSILDILKQKADKGLDIKVLYDDIGCMATLPGNYYKQLEAAGITAVPFSRLRGNADSEFNNRSHRKITVIDGKIGYTGGINLADEYINEIDRFGHWKDTAIRIEGEAVWELTKLFVTDFSINYKKGCYNFDGDIYPPSDIQRSGYIIPFGDGPRPIYKRRVSKSVIQNMLSSATEYVYITTPYLIIDNDMCTSIENAALRGVDVRIILPHIPDKKLVFTMSRSFYNRLMGAGVKIYEYAPGFIHSKSYISDDKYAMIGTVNLDYRSLVHHFENGVWLYNCECIADIKSDINITFEKSIEITKNMLKTDIVTRFIRAVVRIFAPML